MNSLRRSLLRLIPLALFVVSLLVAACGDDDDAPTDSSTPAPTSTEVSVDASRTEEATAALLGHLARGPVAQGDVPAGYVLRVSEPVPKAGVATANASIPRLAQFVQSSDMTGAWVNFFLRDQPQTGLTSVVYEFASPASAQAFVGTIADLTGADYPEAISVERVPSDKIEDAAQMMMYRLTGSRAYDYTWAQGKWAGQVVIRYAGDVDSAEDRSLMLALARRQAELMRAIEQ